MVEYAEKDTDPLKLIGSRIVFLACTNEDSREGCRMAHTVLASAIVSRNPETNSPEVTP